MLDQYRVLARAWSWFESIRNALRVSREMNSSESCNDPVDISVIGRDLGIALAAITEEGKFTGGDP